MKKNINSWGNFNPEIKYKVNKYPNSISYLDIGNLNSYGDCCLPLNSISKIKKSSLVNETIFNYQMKHGNYLYGTPGKSDVTIAGAVASDTHGKDNTWGGSFYKNVKKIHLSVNGDELEISKEKEPELFDATIGGYGLTGTIKDIELYESDINLSETYKTFIETGFGIDNLLSSFNSKNKEFWVGWIDLCNKKFPWVTKKSIPNNNQLKNTIPKKDFEINLSIPFIGKNKFKILFLINKAYFLSNKFFKIDEYSYYKTFFPLSFMTDTRNISKHRKIVQVQFSIPTGNAHLIESLLIKLIKNQTPLLCSIKKLTNQKSLNNLSFYQEGWTVAVDFSYHEFDKTSIKKFYKELSKCGGKIYLAKDSTLDEENFKLMYPEYYEWEKIVKEIDPNNLYQSYLSKRLGLKKW